MPRKHTGGPRRLRAFHVYNQGAKVGGRPRQVFIDRDDKRYFLWLVARHLGPHPASDARGRAFVHLRAKVTLLAYNVMTTHFHLILWQHTADGAAHLMERVKSSYVRYFNDKYGNTKPLFNGPFQAKEIDDADYFRWLVGYVHDNNDVGVDYEFSSHRAWIDPGQRPAWLDPAPGLRAFGGTDEYLLYLQQRDERKSLNRRLGLGRR